MCIYGIDHIHALWIENTGESYPQRNACSVLALLWKTLTVSVLVNLSKVSLKRIF